MTGLAVGCACLLACGEDVEESFELDCSGVDGIRVDDRGIAVLTYRVGQDDVVSWSISPEGAGVFDGPTTAIADTGNLRPFIARNGVTAKQVGSATITLSRQRTEIASCNVDFASNEEPNRRLVVQVEGEGRVASEPAGIDCPDTCEASFVLNSTVTLTTDAQAPWRFGGFAGDCTSSGSGSATVFMSEDRTCTARFLSAPATVPVAGGPFSRGCAVAPCPGDAPLDTVQVSDFEIGVTEVTVADYRACVLSGACTPPRQALPGEAPCNYFEEDRENHPVNCVDWDQSVAFCASVGQRLPTAAEWEKAARGAESSDSFPWGDDSSSCVRANLIRIPFMRCAEETQPVGERTLGNSPFGAADMAGNVEEWVSDWYDASYYADPSSLTDPQGPPSSPNNHREVRGGSFATTEDLGRVFERSRHRSAAGSEPGLGFRCAVSGIDP